MNSWIAFWASANDPRNHTNGKQKQETEKLEKEIDKFAPEIDKEMDKEMNK